MARGRSFDRRRLLAFFAQSAAAIMLANCSREQSAHRPADPAPQLDGFTFFSADEVRFLEAAVSRIIPNDELGPGAKEAGVVVFLDREVGGKYGENARTYTAGPFGAYTPFQGYQLPITIADVYRIAIAAIDLYCVDRFRKPFADLAEARQDEILRGVKAVSDYVSRENIPAKLFFDLLVRDTKDGFFSDPIYGGNRERVGWKLIGYPGAGGNYMEAIFKVDTPYEADPVDMVAHQHNMGMIEK